MCLKYELCAISVFFTRRVVSLELSSENLRMSFLIVESYILLGGIEFLQVKISGFNKRKVIKYLLPVVEDIIGSYKNI